MTLKVDIHLNTNNISESEASIIPLSSPKLCIEVSLTHRATGSERVAPNLLTPPSTTLQPYGELQSLMRGHNGTKWNPAGLDGFAVYIIIY